MFSTSLALLLFVFLIVAIVVKARHGHRSHRRGNGIERQREIDPIHFVIEKRSGEEKQRDGDVLKCNKGEKTPDVIPSGEYSNP